MLLAAGRLIPGFDLAAALGSWLLLGVVPGLCVWGFLLPRARPALGAACALAIGPAVALAPLAAGFAVAQPPSAAAIPVAALLGVAGFVAARRISAPPAAPREESASCLAPWIVGFAILLLSLPFAFAWWRVRSDAWFHAAFALEVRDFGIPPGDPFFAGLPLRYFWLFHLYLAGLSSLSGVSPFGFFALINVQAFVALALVLFLLSATFRRDAASHRLVFLTGVLGLNALFWLFLPLKAVRAFVGSKTGAGELETIFNQFPIEIIRWIDFLAPLDGAQPFFLSKFFVGSAFSIGFALGALVLLLVARACAGAPRAEAAALGLALAGVWAFHPDVALFVGPACVAGIAAALAARGGGERTRPGALAPWILAAAAATVLLAPYLLGIGAGKGASDLGFFVPSVRRAVAVACTGAAFLLLAPFAARELASARTPAGRFLLAAGGALALLALAVRLPGSERAQTMDKNPYFLALGLCVPAGWALADLLRGLPAGRRGTLLRLWAAGALLVPANAAMLFGYALGTERFRVGDDERALIEWIRRETPRDAVFFETRGASYTDRMRLPVLGPRRVFCGAEHLAREWHYPEAEIARRAALEERVTGGEAGEPAPAGPLAPGAGYVLWRGEGDASPDSLERTLRPLFRRGPYRVYGLEAGSAAGPQAPSGATLDGRPDGG